MLTKKIQSLCCTILDSVIDSRKTYSFFQIVILLFCLMMAFQFGRFYANRIDDANLMSTEASRLKLSYDLVISEAKLSNCMSFLDKP